MLNYDRQITISAAGSRRATRWPPQTLWWSELVEKVRMPVRGTEPLVEYLRLPKSRQDDLKDVGGFVGGVFTGERRKANAVIGRDIITLDLDSIPPAGTQDALKRIEALGCAYCVYSTRKHEEAKPRLRVLVLLNRTATADEYEPLARKLASIIGIELCDPTTFEASRLMYWPSCCKDSQYVYQYGDKPFLDADGLLALYTNWRDVNEWPQVPGVQKEHTRLAQRQGDPTSKPGIVGAFCRVYDVYRAMEAFLPGIYEPCVDMPGRFTYTGGSTTGGAIVYDDGAFLYSHHATDPCGGRLVNAFDLVRLHRFSDRDDDAKPETPTNRMPSYVAMCELAVADTAVATLLNQERYEQATADFSAPAAGPGTEQGDSWFTLLEISPLTGKPTKTLRNIQTVLGNDPLLAGRIYKDTFAERIMGVAPLPWGARSSQSGGFLWADPDDHGLTVYLEKIIGAPGKQQLEAALSDFSEKHQRNPVAEYLLSVEWDGVPRLDTLLIDYLRAEDSKYTRTVTRKTFVAAVARAMAEKPVKYDNMLVVSGAQSIGKSTLFAKMGKDWFSDSVKTFEGKEAEELIQGKWIVEIAELQALDKTDTNRVKHFLTKQDDQYRRAYGKYPGKQLRRCIFVGTTNDTTFLRDVTGNRRFWPMRVHADHKKGVFAAKSSLTDLDAEVDQIWAEAVMRWRLGEPLYLSGEMEAEAERICESHMERDPLQGVIEEFLDRKIPEDWDEWGVNRRQMFWNDSHSRSGFKLVTRSKACVAEIWREALGEYRPASRYDSVRVTNILRLISGWEDAGVQRFGGGYGRQKGFRRVPGFVACLNQVSTDCQPTVNRVSQPVFGVSTKTTDKNESVDGSVDTKKGL